MKYSLSSQAQDDLIQIGQYTLNSWNAKQAKKYLAGIRALLQSLCEMPQMGERRPDVKHGVYSFPYESHVIYYTLRRDELIVVGILHKRSVPLNHLEL